MADEVSGEKHGFFQMNNVWVFLKAQASAQFASLVDFVSTLLLVKIMGVFYLYATFAGAVAGGITNCIINYKWVFVSTDCPKSHVAAKYLFVWGGSILLNTWGTFALTEWLTGKHWVKDWLGPYVDDLFIISKIVVALLVSVCWNYHLQRTFVYRNHDFKNFWQQYLNK